MLERRAAALGLGQKVHWPGMLKGDAKWGAFRECEAFILPSHQENFGIVVAEAMSCGRPVLISNKVNIWREIEIDGAGLVAADDLAGATTLLRRFLMMAPSDRKPWVNAPGRHSLRDSTSNAQPMIWKGYCRRSRPVLYQGWKMFATPQKMTVRMSQGGTKRRVAARTIGLIGRDDAPRNVRVPEHANPLGGPDRAGLGNRLSPECLD